MGMVNMQLLENRVGYVRGWAFLVRQIFGVPLHFLLVIEQQVQKVEGLKRMGFGKEGLGCDLLGNTKTGQVERAENASPSTNTLVA